MEPNLWVAMKLIEFWNESGLASLNENLRQSEPIRTLQLEFGVSNG